MTCNELLAEITQLCERGHGDRELIVAHLSNDTCKGDFLEKGAGLLGEDKIILATKSVPLICKNILI